MPLILTIKPGFHTGSKFPYCWQLKMSGFVLEDKEPILAPCRYKFSPVFHVQLCTRDQHYDDRILEASCDDG